MSLLDLKSDLSKFRYNAPKPTTTLPKNRQSQNSYDNNFGTYKPITDGLIDNRPGVVQPKNINLPDKLKDTRLDDTIKKVFQEMLINSVSEYSPKSIEYNFGSPSSISLESIVSAFSKINTSVVQSSIDKSDVQISRTQQGTNNNDSNIEIIDNGSEVGNIVNPNVTLNNIPLTYERERQSADITVNPDDAKDNIQNPDINLNNIPLTFNRELQSADLEKGFGLREFIVDANSNKLLSDSILNIDRTPEKYRTQSRIENKEITEKVDTSRYSGQISELAIADSILDLTNPEQTILSGRHETDKNSSLSNSKDNIVDYFGNENAEGFTKKVEPLKTEYVNNSSNLGYETILEANYFDITNQYTTDGFESFAREYDSKYKPDASRFDWEGAKENVPVVNYFDVTNQFTKNGFTSFAEKFKTEYKTESSEYDWDGIRQNAPSVNYFDLTGANTKEGFHTFAIEYDSKYVNESSKYDWDGERNDAPEVNYFDRILRHTSKGFHKFAVTKEPTAYTNDGVSLLSGGPGVGTSDFDWDGTSINAPTNDFLNPNGYFDQINQFTTQGFHTFAQIYDTKYIPESSQFDWDGLRSQAPTNDANNPNGYFDQNNRFTYRGFHTFASPIEATSYTNTSPGQPVTAGGVFLLGGGVGVGTSDFDWDGGGAQFNSTTSQVAPAVNYFDANGRFTFRGFHIFARPLEATSYTNTSPGQPVTAGGVFLLGGGAGVGTSDLDWDGGGAQFNSTTSQVAPAVNYFDTNGRFTFRGFHIFARPLEATSYTNTSPGQPVTAGGVFLLGGALGAGTSDLDWDGGGAQFSATTSQVAPAVNYFDANGRFTFRGFHIQAQTLEPTSYTNTSPGQPVTAGGVFLLGGALGAGTSDLDWDGGGAQFSATTSQVAPAVNFFDANGRFTFRGFHIFARPLEPTSYTNTSPGQPVTAGGVFLLGGALGAGTSDLDWDGAGSQFSATTSQVAPAVNFFDPTNRFTFRGFHIQAQTLEPTSYTNTNQGQPITGAGVFLLGGALGAGTSDLDWDGGGQQFNPSPSQVAPAVNFFDANGRFTFRGFHIFARPLEPTSYTNNNQGQPVTSGGVFLLGGALGAGTSDLDWDGAGSQFSATTSQVAPAVNYFDPTNRFTFRGFHIQAQTLEPTSYTNTNQGQPITGAGAFLLGGALGAGTSDLDWDGGGQQFNPSPSQVAPAVNYFDFTNRFTFRGFHIQAQPLEPTSYTNTNQGQPITAGGVFLLGGGIGAGTSDLDWDGDGQQFSANTTQVAPAVNYFDLNNRATFRGFHIQAQPLEPTSYTNTNQGQPITSGGVFLLGGALGAGSSDLDWDGAGAQFSATTSQVAPAVNYFDANGRFTFRGFHIQARPLEPTSYTNNNQNQPITGPGTFLLGGALGAGTSDLDWDGGGSQFSATTSQVAPAVNYFDSNNRFTFRGFHIQARPLEPTSYTNTNQGQPISAGGVSLVGGAQGVGTSDFDWDGTDPYGMRTTRFFGFTQTNRFGFMVNMSQLDGTAYPIITPQFNASILNLASVPQKAQRFALSLFRQILQPLQTNNLEQFAPLSFGGKSISGFKATLDNQSPVVNVQKYGFNITGYRRRGKTVGQLVDQTNGSTFVINPARVLPFMDVNRYTLGGGVDTQPTFVDGQMAIWANSGDVNAAFQTFTTTGTPVLTAAEVVALNRSFNGLPYYNGVLYKSHIDYQYSKYNLVKDSFNTSTTYPQPFVDTSLNGEDRDVFAALRSAVNLPNTVSLPGSGTFDLSSVKNSINQAISFIDKAQSFDDGIVRGGIIKNTIRALLDTKRITKFLLSPKGLLWNAKQIGLQFMNPMVDTGTGLLGIAGALGLPGGVLGVNWTNIYNPLSVPLNVAGRAGILGLRLARHGVLMYGEGAYEDIAVTRQENTDNRKFEDFTSPGSLNRTSDYNRLVSLTKELLPDSYRPILLTKDMPTPDTSTEIKRLSTFFGGPGSFLGLFGTTINRSTHPYKGINSTGYFPKAQDIRDGKDREVFWGSTEEDSAAGTYKKYSEFVQNATIEPDDGSGGIEFSGILLALRQYIKDLPITGDDATEDRNNPTIDPDTPYGMQKITARRLFRAGFSQWKHPNPSERLRNISGESLSTLRGGIQSNEMLNRNQLDKDTDPRKSYETAGYEDLTTKRDGGFSNIGDSAKFRDFRSSFAGKKTTQGFISSPKVINFKQNNLEYRFGIGSAGDPGNDRSRPYVSTVQYSSLLPNQKNSDPTVKTTENVLANYKYAAYPTQKPKRLKVTKEEQERFQGDVINPITGEVEPGSGTVNNQTTKTFDIPMFRGDRINIIDWKRSTTDLSSAFVYEKVKNSAQSTADSIGGAEDLIQFYFTGARLKGSEFNPTEALVFRAYIDTIVDNHKPSWSPIKYIGRADPVYSYDGYERDINFGFTVHIGSRDEMKATWRKLNMLASWTAPEYTTNGFMRAPVIRLNLGNLYRKFPGFLSTLTYTFDNTQTTWETAKLKEDQNFSDVFDKALSMPGVLELPKTINVQCTFVTFNMYRPEWDCVFYSLFDDESGDGSLETGLAPMHDDRVNYFRTFDDLPVSHIMNSGLCAIIDRNEPPKKPVEKKPETKPKEVVQEKKTPPTQCLCPINFYVDEDRYVTPESENSIKELAKWLNETCDCARITLIGHANRSNPNLDIKDKKNKNYMTGDEKSRDAAYNKRLSLARAETIKLILEKEYGIDPKRINVMGKGYEQKMQGVDSASDPKNIRIEIRIDNAEGDAKDCIKISTECLGNTKCSPLTQGHRKDIGDRSQFWLVGPGYFTKSYDGPMTPELEAVSEKVNGTWWFPVEDPYTSVVAQSWRTKWNTKAYRVAGYAIDDNLTGWSPVDSNSQGKTVKTRRKYIKNGGFGTFTINPKHRGSLLPGELDGIEV